MHRIYVQVEDEEKKKFDIAKAKSDYNTWKDFFLSLIEEEGEEDD